MGENVEFPAQVKSLGVILYQDLNMRAHLNKVRRNTMSSLVDIAHIAKLVDRKSRRQRQGKGKIKFVFRDREQVYISFLLQHKK